MKPGEAAAKYNINSKIISKFTYKKRSLTKRNYDKKGRPLILDNEITNEIERRYRFAIPILTFNNLSDFKKDLRQNILRSALFFKQIQSTEVNQTANKKKCISLSTLNRRLKEFTATFIKYVIIINN